MGLKTVPKSDARSRAMMDGLTQEDVDAMSPKERKLFKEMGFRTGDRTSAEMKALYKKYADRGRTGDKVLKEKLEEHYADTVGIRQRDANLVKKYGKDAMKARSFESPTAPKSPSLPASGASRPTPQPKQGKLKRAKGGMIGGKKRYMNGGMVMSNRGVRDTKMS